MTFKLVLKLSNIKKKVPNEIIFKSQYIIGEREVLRNHGARQDPCLRILLGVLKHLRLLETELKKHGLTIFHPPTHQCVYIHQKALTYLESLDTASAYPQMPDDFKLKFGLCQFAPRT